MAGRAYNFRFINSKQFSTISDEWGSLQSWESVIFRVVLSIFVKIIYPQFIVFELIISKGIFDCQKTEEMVSSF